MEGKYFKHLLDVQEMNEYEVYHYISANMFLPDILKYAIAKLEETADQKAIYSCNRESHKKFIYDNLDNIKNNCCIISENVVSKVYAYYAIGYDLSNKDKGVLFNIPVFTKIAVTRNDLEIAIEKIEHMVNAIYLHILFIYIEIFDYDLDKKEFELISSHQYVPHEDIRFTKIDERLLSEKAIEINEKGAYPLKLKQF